MIFIYIIGASLFISAIVSILLGSVDIGKNEIDINGKYLSACNYAIKEKEKALNRKLTGEEMQKIMSKIKKDFY